MQGNLQTYIQTGTTLECKSVPKEDAHKFNRIRINFCVPGETFSNNFLQSWTQMLSWSSSTNIDFFMYNVQTSNIYHGRELLLQGDVNGDDKQKPFHGEKYDYILFVDSDQVWTPQDVDLLLKANKDVVGGCIKMADGNYAQGWYDEHEFAKKGYTLRLVDEFLNNVESGLVEVTLIGCGFTLVKYGCIERLKFPWFEPLKYPWPKAGYYGEDMSMFTRLRREGIKMYVHPKVRIGHEKMHILR